MNVRGAAADEQWRRGAADGRQRGALGASRGSGYRDAVRRSSVNTVSVKTL
jgi:hypothetical protein